MGQDLEVVHSLARDTEPRGVRQGHAAEAGEGGHPQTVRKPQRDSPCQPVLFKLGFSSCDQPHTYGTHAQVRPPSPPTQPYIHISVQVNIPSRRVSTFFLPPPPLSPPAVSAAPMTFPPSSVFAGSRRGPRRCVCVGGNHLPRDLCSAVLVVLRPLPTPTHPSHCSCLPFARSTTRARTKDDEFTGERRQGGGAGHSAGGKGRCNDNDNGAAVRVPVLLCGGERGDEEVHGVRRDVVLLAGAPAEPLEGAQGRVPRRQGQEEGDRGGGGRPG